MKREKSPINANIYFDNFYVQTASINIHRYISNNCQIVRNLWLYSILNDANALSTHLFFYELLLAHTSKSTINSSANLHKSLRIWCVTYAMRDTFLQFITKKKTVCKFAANWMNTFLNIPTHIQSWTVERFKWHKNDFKKITRESTMNVPIKKITNVNNNRISAGTSIWLDMCEFVESARKCTRLHRRQLPLLCCCCGC